MLALSGFPGEFFVINDNITVHVIEVRSDGLVRLGFVAPKEVIIHRRKIWEKINRKPYVFPPAEERERINGNHR